jgi:hypothetical protein
VTTTSAAPVLMFFTTAQLIAQRGVGMLATSVQTPLSNSNQVITEI